MIKVKQLNEILNSVSTPEVLDCSAKIFKEALKSDAPVNHFVVDFSQMGVPGNVISAYHSEGLSVLNPVVASKKKIDINAIPANYIIYTGLLNHEFVIGYEPKKNLETNIYTKSKALLEKLHQAGAFDNEEKYQKSMKALFGESGSDFGNKVLASLEKDSLALGRIDIVGVIGDEVSLDLTIPTKFRSDYGTDFVLIPYTVFPYLAKSLFSFVNGFKERTFTEVNRVTNQERKVSDIRAINVMQVEPDGDLKIRKVAFDGKELLKAYSRGARGLSVEETKDFEEQVKLQIRKTVLGWDCLKKQIRVFNTEASVYSVPYSVIKLERLVKITPCTLKDIDTSMYLIDFDNVRRLFTSRVNNWRISEFEEFGSFVNTSGCANIEERIQLLNRWADGLDDVDLWKAMKAKRPLFERMKDDSSKGIEEGLSDMYKRKPTAQKRMRWVDLETDMDARLTQVRNLLSTGICQIESVSSKTGAPRKFIATNNESVLDTVYGKNQRLSYESPKRSLKLVKTLIQNGKIVNLQQFLRDLQTAGVDGLVDYSSLNDSSSVNDFILIVDNAITALEQDSYSKSSTTNSAYVVNFRRVNADNEKEYYGAVDVRNIEALLFGEQKKK
jgi:hypothetical protein